MDPQSELQRVRTCEQVRQLDRHCAEVLGLPGLVLMENAGRGIVEWLRRKAAPVPTLIVCGSGNNGGDGFVVARQLDALGWPVDVWLSAPAARIRGDAAANLSWLAATTVRLHTSTEPFPWTPSSLDQFPLIIDGLLGTGFQGPLRGPIADVLAILADHDQHRAHETLVAQGKLRVAIDIPSGLSGDGGPPAPTTFRATHTLTLVCPKPALLDPRNRPYVGQLEVVPLGIPRRVLEVY